MARVKQSNRRQTNLQQSAKKPKSSNSKTLTTLNNIKGKFKQTGKMENESESSGNNDSDSESAEVDIRSRYWEFYFTTCDKDYIFSKSNFVFVRYQKEDAENGKTGYRGAFGFINAVSKKHAESFFSGIKITLTPIKRIEMARLYVFNDKMRKPGTNIILVENGIEYFNTAKKIGMPVSTVDNTEDKIEDKTSYIVTQKVLNTLERKITNEMTSEIELYKEFPNQYIKHEKFIQLCYKKIENQNSYPMLPSVCIVSCETIEDGRNLVIEIARSINLEVTDYLHKIRLSYYDNQRVLIIYGESCCDDEKTILTRLIDNGYSEECLTELPLRFKLVFVLYAKSHLFKVNYNSYPSDPFVTRAHHYIYYSGDQVNGTINYQSLYTPCEIYCAAFKFENQRKLPKQEFFKMFANNLDLDVKDVRTSSVFFSCKSQDLVRDEVYRFLIDEDSSELSTSSQSRNVRSHLSHKSRESKSDNDIVNNDIVNNDIGYNSIGDNEIVNNEIVNSEIVNNEIANNEIDDKSIVDNDIVNNEIVNNEIDDKSIVDNDIDDKSIVDNDIDDKSIVNNDIDDKSIVDNDSSSLANYEFPDNSNTSETLPNNNITNLEDNKEVLDGNFKNELTEKDSSTVDSKMNNERPLKNDTHFDELPTITTNKDITETSNCPELSREVVTPSPIQNDVSPKRAKISDVLIESEKKPQSLDNFDHELAYLYAFQDVQKADESKLSDGQFDPKRSDLETIAKESPAKSTEHSAPNVNPITQKPKRAAAQAKLVDPLGSSSDITDSTYELVTPKKKKKKNNTEAHKQPVKKGAKKVNSDEFTTKKNTKKNK